MHLHEIKFKNLPGTCSRTDFCDKERKRQQ